MSTTDPSTRPDRLTLLLTAAGALGVISSFVSTVIAFKGIAAAGAGAKLIGADNELGFPSSAFALALFVVVLAVGMAGIAGAQFQRSWWTGIVPVVLIGVIFEIWVVYLALVGNALTAPFLVQLILFAVALGIVIARTERARENAVFGTFLTVAAIVGFFAAFRLSVDKVGTFITPDRAPSCNFSIIVTCGKNLSSWQGSLFGFPNPIIGVGGWIAVLVIGILLLSGLQFARWFWIAFNLGMLGALAFVIWLLTESIFDLHTLCPWCMTTWAVVIPTFWLVTFRNVKVGVFGGSKQVRAAFAFLYGVVPLITLLSYVVIAVIAQVQLDVLSYL